MTADNILNYLQSNTAVLKKYKVKKIGLFGSYAKGCQSQDSDIDFLVEYLPGQKSFDNFIYLIDHLEAGLNKNVEVITPESISDSFLNHIRSDLKYVQVRY
ncbi:MAG: polymerase beta domain protein region [Sphingobacteriaceae bacterium]|jgi:predicted nucleotidyltransferase|nr:polymerase beta domain protein region [Sphingobacteriaceae bacterium]